MNILIIENSLPMRQMIRSFVNHLDADIRECNDAAGVLSNAPEPDWVLFNLEIKNRNGLTEMARLKQRWAVAKVIVMTTYDEIELREEARQAGAWGYVLKDDLSQLRDLVRL